MLIERSEARPSYVALQKKPASDGKIARARMDCFPAIGFDSLAVIPVTRAPDIVYRLFGKLD
jgi:hypothetical protein